MWARIFSLPLIIVLLGIVAVTMLAPAIYAAAGRDWDTARAFLYSSLMFLVLFAMLGVATANYPPPNRTKSQLLALLGAYLLLPAVMAVPFVEAQRDTTFVNAYFEMVSCLTTTGATLYEDPDRLSGAVHMWRAMVGWMGGFLVLVSAVAIMAPLNLGGYEVLSIRERTGKTGAIQGLPDPAMRMRRYAVRLFPVFAMLTLALWVALLVTGEPPLVAILHAMSTLSTSGITAGAGMATQTGSFMAELCIFVFLLFALSRRTFEREGQTRRAYALLHDPELRMAASLALALPMLLFLRHWFGAIEVEAGQAVTQAVTALWGGLFTVMSFLTTTGFESIYWADAQSWSGLETPGIVLVGLALVGGGVATTAGGIKLLRVYALFLHGRRELDRLVHPNSIGGAGQMARHLRSRGAQIAWIFFMLFAISVAAVMLALSLTGLDFERSVVMALMALSNTGPLATMALEDPVSLTALGNGAKAILVATMILGRLEALVIIALFNPEFWRA
ncbi:MAG: potassium transporter TrkG [Pseudomonadota bacterium]